MTLTKQQIQTGFTIIEMIVTVALLSVMLAVAVPGFGNLMQNNTIVSATNGFVSNLAYARNEAISRNTEITVCTVSSTGGAIVYPLSCASDGRWETGWVVWGDANDNNQIDNGEQILIAEPLPDGYTLRAENSVFSNKVEFSSAGDATGDLSSAADIFNLCDPTQDTTRSRAIHLNGVGRAWVNLNSGTGQCP